MHICQEKEKDKILFWFHSGSVDSRYGIRDRLKETTRDK